MALKRSMIAMCSLLLALSGAYACGDDGGDDDKGGSNNGGDGDGDGDGMKTISGYVADSLDETATLGGIKVKLFNPEDGTFYDGETVTNASGRFTIKGPEGAGVFVEGNGDWSDGWNHPPSRKGEEEYFRMSSKGSASIVPQLAGYTNNPDAAPLAGAVYWRNAEGRDEYVGCVVIETVPGKVEDVRYFANNLPTSLEKRGADQGTVPYDGGNAGEAGKFFVANLFAGKQTITAKINGEVVAEREVFIVPRKDGNRVDTDPPQNSNVHFAAMWIDDPKYTSNPTPADCK